MWLPYFLLLTDDAIAILAVTWLGLRFHQTDALLFERLPFTFLPFYAAWLLAAFLLELYKPDRAGNWAYLWRVPLAAAFAAFLGAPLRSLWLGTPLQPIFILVMGLAIAIGLLISRSIYILAFGKRWLSRG